MCRVFAFLGSEKMADVLNKTTFELRRSVNAPDYSDSDWLKNPDIDALAGVDKRYWILDGSTVREMTTAEKNARLSDWKTEHLLALKVAVNEYGESRYSTNDEMRLKHAYNRAKTELLINRAAYCKQVLDWEDSLFSEYGTRVGIISNATTHDAVFAVSLDFSSFDATDPMVSVAGAKSIPN